MIFVRKVTKIPEIYMIFAPIMPKFYIVIARKIFLGGGARTLPAPRLLRLCRSYLEDDTRLIIDSNMYI